MRNYWDNQARKVSAHIDPVICVERFWDGTEIKTYEANIKKAKDIVTAIELLGYNVKKITVKAGTYLDMDTKFYKRYSDEILDKVWNSIHNSWSNDREVFIKGNRLYVKEGEYEIILPKKMYSNYDNHELWLVFYYE